MPAGILIYNDFDTILIDENYTNMSMISSGIVDTLDEGDDELIASAILPFTLAFGEKVALNSSAVYSTLVGNVVYTSAPGTVYWYRFGPPPAPAVSGFGLQVFNTAGACTFDSSRRYARVMGSMTGTINALPTQAFPAGRGYGVIHSRRGVRAQIKVYNLFQVDQYRARYYMSTAARQNGSTIEFALITTHLYATGSGTAYDTAQLDVQILDISGYLGN